jgi:hypothetical protein
MERTPRASWSLCLAAGWLLAALPASGNAQEPVLGPLDVPTIPATPFSAVGITQTIRQTGDGNRFSRISTTRYYRDSQGRTRIERELPRVRLSADAEQTFLQVIEIRDVVKGELIMLNPQTKTAQTFSGMQFRTPETPGTPPPIFAVFQNTRIAPNDRGWSALVQLGEKSVDGLDAIGTQRAYTVPAGSTLGNEKPVTVTVEQWYSPALGMILSKRGRSGSAQTDYHLEQIVQGEPDASLFAVPAGYHMVTLPALSQKSTHDNQ